MVRKNKSDFIAELAWKLHTTASETERMVNTFFQIIYDTLNDNGEVNLSGFGKFKVSHREARLGVNPRQPSQKITIPALVTPKFRSGEAFKEAIRPALKK